MRLDEILFECEEVYTDENDNILDEGATRHFKRVGSLIKKQYLCTSGPKKGRIVSSPTVCMKRKEPKKVRLGRKIARAKKGIRILKSKLTKNKSISKLVRNMNKRIKRK